MEIKIFHSLYLFLAVLHTIETVVGYSTESSGLKQANEIS